MNIFYLDQNPALCAQYHADKHCVKMILEYSQLMSTAYRVLNGVDIRICYSKTRLSPPKIKKHRMLFNDLLELNLYKQTHTNHPSAVWTREYSDNYRFVFDLWCELLKEYTARYGKQHKTGRLYELLAVLPANIAVGASPIAQCMPDQYKHSDPVKAYRSYYLDEKKSILQYKLKTPEWIANCS